MPGGYRCWFRVSSDLRALMYFRGHTSVATFCVVHLPLVVQTSQAPVKQRSDRMTAR